MKMICRAELKPNIIIFPPISRNINTSKVMFFIVISLQLIFDLFGIILNVQRMAFILRNNIAPSQIDLFCFLFSMLLYLFDIILKAYQIYIIYNSNVKVKELFKKIFWITFTIQTFIITLILMIFVIFFVFNSIVISHKLKILFILFLIYNLIYLVLEVSSYLLLIDLIHLTKYDSYVYRYSAIDKIIT